MIFTHHYPHPPSQSSSQCHCCSFSLSIKFSSIQFFLPTMLLTCPGHDPLELLDSDPPIWVDIISFEGRLQKLLILCQASHAYSELYILLLIMRRKKWHWTMSTCHHHELKFVCDHNNVLMSWIIDQGHPSIRINYKGDINASMHYHFKLYFD